MTRACLILAIAAAGCHHGAALDDDTPALVVPKDALVKTTDHGPVKATVTVWPAKPTLGDPIYVRLEVDSAPGSIVDVPFQEAGEQAMGRFKVAAFTRESHHNGDGHTVEQQTYTLEAPASGRQRIPPFRMTATTGSGSADEVLTDEVPLEVAPVKTEEVDAKLRPAAGTLDADVGGRPWWIVGLAGAVLVLGSGSVLLARALRARKKLRDKKTAYDEAVAHLRELERRGAPGAETADTWFVELSAIVRRYLERRYDIRAPELTTEEFLQELSRGAAQVGSGTPAPAGELRISAEHRALLVQFLERCDRVKFAGYRPDSDESLATLNAARGFVEDTRLRDDLAVPAARRVA
jgi:hypothetical protein